MLPIDAFQEGGRESANRETEPKEVAKGSGRQRGSRDKERAT